MYDRHAQLSVVERGISLDEDFEYEFTRALSDCSKQGMPIRINGIPV